MPIEDDPVLTTEGTHLTYPALPRGSGARGEWSGAPEEVREGFHALPGRGVPFSWQGWCHVKYY